MPVMSWLEQSFCRNALWSSFASRTVLPWAVRHHQLRGSLLELGAGDGSMGAETLRVFPELHVTLTDVDPSMVAAAERRFEAGDRVAVQLADATDLPFADSSFDTVASYLMMHHVVGWRAALSEALRVLEPGGALIGYDLTRTPLAKAIHVVDRSPHRLIDPVELGEALSALGFDAVHVERSLLGHVMRFSASKPVPPPGGRSANE